VRHLHLMRFDPNSEPSRACALSCGDERRGTRSWIGKKLSAAKLIFPRPTRTRVSHVGVVVEWDASPRWQHEDSHGKCRLLSKVYVPDLPGQCRRRDDVLVGVGDHPQRRRGEHRHRLSAQHFQIRGWACCDGHYAQQRNLHDTLLMERQKKAKSAAETCARVNSRKRESASSGGGRKLGSEVCSQVLVQRCTGFESTVTVQR